MKGWETMTTVRVAEAVLILSLIAVLAAFGRSTMGWPEPVLIATVHLTGANWESIDENDPPPPARDVVYHIGRDGPLQLPPGEVCDLTVTQVNPTERTLHGVLTIHYPSWLKVVKTDPYAIHARDGLISWRVSIPQGGKVEHTAAVVWDKGTGSPTGSKSLHASMKEED